MAQLEYGAEEARTDTEWQIRPYREGDIPALVALINAADAIDKQSRGTTESELESNFAQPLSDPPNQVIICEGPHIDGAPSGVPLGYGRVVGFGDEGANEQIYQMVVRTHPAARPLGLEAELVHRLVGMARAMESAAQRQQDTKVNVLTNVREQDNSLRDAYIAVGLEPIRWGWVMERDLTTPIDTPREIEGVTVRNFERPGDYAALTQAYNNSFIDHFEFHALSQEIVEYMAGRPDTKPDLSWVAEIAGQEGVLAGFCMCEIQEEANKREGKQEGWIALLGTVRGWRGRGLGKSLLLKGMHSLREAGMDTALLGVDSESPTGANRLYESVGFRVRRKEIMMKNSLSALTT